MCMGCATARSRVEYGSTASANIRLAYPYSLPSASHEASMNRSADIWPNICTGYVYRVMGIAGRVPHAAPANQIGLTQLAVWPPHSKKLASGQTPHNLVVWPPAEPHTVWTVIFFYYIDWSFIVGLHVPNLCLLLNTRRHYISILDTSTAGCTVAGCLL